GVVGDKSREVIVPFLVEQLRHLTITGREPRNELIVRVADAGFDEPGERAASFLEVGSARPRPVVVVIARAVVNRSLLLVALEAEMPADGNPQQDQKDEGKTLDHGVILAGARGITVSLAAVPISTGVSAPSSNNTAPTSGWEAQYNRVFSTPRIKKAVARASASAAVGARAVELATPSAGRPVLGSSKCPSRRLLYSKCWNVAAEVPSAWSRRCTIAMRRPSSHGWRMPTGQPRSSPGCRPIARTLLPPACSRAERTPR